MTQRMSLTILGAPTEEGADLIRRATVLAEGLGYSVAPAETLDQWGLVRAAFSSDVVLFDGTIEDEQEHIYHAGALLPSLVDHLLVVARSYLPINFLPARRGGAPDYPFPHFDPRIDKVRQSWSNEDILTWLKAQLLDCRARGPRRKDVDIDAVAATNDPEQVGRAMMGFYRSSEPHVDTSGRVFLSYRSHCWKEVEALKGCVERGELHGIGRKSVEVLSPGALAYEGELLTAMRRWQLLSFIDRLIGDCAEVIAYRSDDYLNSWWTRGEMITLAYRRGSGSQSQPGLRVFDPTPEPGRLADAPPELLPAMTDSQLRRMARWYAHTDPQSMGPETVGFNRVVHKVIRFVPAALLAPILKGFSRTDQARMMEVVGEELGGEEGGKMVSRQLTDAAAVKEFFRDEIWSDAFWDDVLFECPRGRTQAKGNGLDLANFLSARPAHMTGLGPDKMSEVVNRGAISCHQCGGSHAVVAAPPRYLWAPLRHGQTRTATRTGLQRLDTYVALSEPAG
jgi:hypothetical protein